MFGHTLCFRYPSKIQDWLGFLIWTKLLSNDIHRNGLRHAFFERREFWSIPHSKTAQNNYLTLIFFGDSDIRLQDIRTNKFIMKRANGGTHKNHIYQTAVSGFVDNGTICHMVNYKSCITSHVSCPHQKQAVHSHSLVIKKKDDKLKKILFYGVFITI